MARILVVDDEPRMRRVLEIALREEGHDVTCAGDGLEGWEKFQEEAPHLVITDVKMPGMSGMEFLEKIKGFSDDIPVIVMTAYGTVDSAVEAIKQGAYHYVIKPINMDEMKVMVEKALQFSTLLHENRALRETAREAAFGQIVGRSSAMARIYQVIDQISDSTATVFICGKSGTGKELIARAIHSRSLRKDHPFIPVDCAAIPETLLESELFGHEKGAFTNASGKRSGKFELADRGTIFLDEITEMQVNMQAKFLRTLQEREFTRVGGNVRIKVDVRVIAATNRDLPGAIQEGVLREDLYYRLNVVPIEVPELKDRLEDIPLLVDHFLKIYCRENKVSLKSLSPEALTVLGRYTWPGNVRELENLVQQLVLLVKSAVIDTGNLPTWVRGGVDGRLPFSDRVEIPPDGVDLPEIIQDLEARYIKAALEQSGNVVTRAARLLGMTRKMLRYKRDKLRL